ncbi:MAG TPA: SMC-Scp complex subunit ScpB [Candidatus Acidoferrales bacterium]|nr:SMC-Scp complex subunit ScpB [Candidatus Acidoferrales bacterium]
MTEQELLSALEAIIYAADEPATLDQIVAAVTGEKPHVRETSRQESPAENSGDVSAKALDASENTIVGADFLNRPVSAETQGPLQTDAVENSEVHRSVQGASHAQVRAEIRSALDKLVASYAADERGIEIRKVAGGWKMYTKAQHHELVRRFIKALRPPLRLTMPALETLSVIAYKQPATLPEINEIRGVNCGGVVKTLLERRLITTAGRKDAVGRPILYRTSKDFLMRFGLADLDELPSLKEFEQLAQAALGADDGIAPTEPGESSQEFESVPSVAVAAESAESPSQLPESSAESSSQNPAPAEPSEAAIASAEASEATPSDAEPKEKSAGA